LGEIEAMGKWLRKAWRRAEDAHTLHWIVGIIGGSGMSTMISHFIRNYYSLVDLIVFCVSLLLLSTPFIISRLTRSALEVIFDKENLGNQFWSLKAVTFDDKIVSGIEYRVKVRNRTNKTIYGVKATIENIGPMGKTPTGLICDQTGEPTFTLDPNASAFIRLFFIPLPIEEPGTLTRESAFAYGPIKVVVSALDTIAVEREFQFNPRNDPMIAMKK
jgi:hypothetical protein